MNQSQLKKIAEFISNEILKQPDRAIGKDEALISSGLIDSFSLIDLSLFIEQTFDVRIDDTELNANTFDTIEELIDLITHKN
jgi:acyl carrier protein